MSDGVLIISMSMEIIDFMDSLVGKENTADFMFIFGMWGFLVLHFAMPLRIFWHVKKAVKREKLHVGSVRLFLAIVCLALSFFGVVEAWYFLNRSVAIIFFMMPILLIAPLVFYMVYELLIFNMKDMRKIF